MAEQPNDASRKSKAEGDRWRAAASRGDSKPAPRAALDTPRRYDQPIEADGDPVMPGDGATTNTKI